METKTLSLPKLRKLNPSLESTALKIMEEAGELSEAIGKFRGMNGEKISMTNEEIMEEIASELLDVAQTAVTMMFVLEEDYQVDIEQSLKKHNEKLIAKGYV